MDEITQQDIDNAIDNCDIKIEADGINICRDNVYPCSRVIERGGCEAIRKLFNKPKKENEE